MQTTVNTAMALLMLKTNHDAMECSFWILVSFILIVCACIYCYRHRLSPQRVWTLRWDLLFGGGMNTNGIMFQYKPHLFNVYISIHITDKLCCWKYCLYYLFECGKYFRIHFSKIIYIENLLCRRLHHKSNEQTLFQTSRKMNRKWLSTA